MQTFKQLVLIAAVCFSVAGCFLETKDASYATASEAVESGMITKGWIPAWLPRDATDLREVHNVDSNVSELSFAIPSNGSVRLPSDCLPAKYSNTVPAYIRRSWWPREEDLESSYVFFKCPHDHTEYKFIALRKAGNRVLLWRTYAR